MVAKGIEAISISFTAGVIISAAVGLEAGFASTALLAVCLVSALFLLWAKPGNPVPYLILFFLCGVFCHANTMPWKNSPSESRGLGLLCRAIDSIPFAHKESGALVKALLTGIRSDIPKDITLSFRQSGASHILALSGLHLGVIAGIVSTLLKVIGNSRPSSVIRSILTVLFCLYYTLMTGGNPSTVRALLFICLRECGKIWPSRKEPPSKIYCSALLIQLAISPEVISSLGFQLSYLAMLGIFVVFPVLQKWHPDSGNATLDKYSPSKWIWNSVALSISCQIFTAPLVWLRFKTFPKYFLLTNLLALPLAEGLIVCAVLTLFLSVAGVCPQFMISCTDTLATAMIGTLGIIAGL